MKMKEGVYSIHFTKSENEWSWRSTFRGFSAAFGVIFKVLVTEDS